jgi:hypothetical protein
MQNFKEYLQGLKTHYPTLVINFDKHSRNDKLDNNKEDVVNSLNELGFPKTVDLDISDNSGTCVVRLELSKSYSKQELFKISHEYIDYLQKITDIKFEKASDDWYPTIVIRNTLPSNLVFGTSKLVMNFSNASNVSLSGIHKQIKEFDRIAIYGSENISSSVLGLILLNEHTEKKIFFLNIAEGDEKIKKWVDIVEKALSQNDDILDVQEELITNGYRHLAKL